VQHLIDVFNTLIALTVFATGLVAFCAFWLSVILWLMIGTKK
jgi:hypothetical protein